MTEQIKIKKLIEIKCDKCDQVFAGLTEKQASRYKQMHNCQENKKWLIKLEKRYK